MLHLVRAPTSFCGAGFTGFQLPKVRKIEVPDYGYIPDFGQG